MSPGFGEMVYWRFKEGERSWKFGYVTDAGKSLIRMGRWNGDTIGGFVVDPKDIEWKEYP